LETLLQTSWFFVDECKQTGVTCSRAMLVKYPGPFLFCIPQFILHPSNIIAATFGQLALTKTSGTTMPHLGNI
jgi:hypothetical protein